MVSTFVGEGKQECQQREEGRNEQSARPPCNQHIRRGERPRKRPRPVIGLQPVLGVCAVVPVMFVIGFLFAVLWTVAVRMGDAAMRRAKQFEAYVGAAR